LCWCLSADIGMHCVPIRRLFDESKVIASETLSATRRELGSKISNLQQQVSHLEAELTEANNERKIAEEEAEKLRHDIAMTKHDNDLLRSELATSQGELSGKLTVRQNITKGEICKLSAEVFALQNNLMEQAQKSAETEKRGALAYQQNLLDLNNLLERSREMRERDRAAFATALEVAHAEARDKEACLNEAHDTLQKTVIQLAESRQDSKDLSERVKTIERLFRSKESEAARRIVAAVSMKTKFTRLQAVLLGWKVMTRPVHDLPSRLNTIHCKRLSANVLLRWHRHFSQQRAKRFKKRAMQKRRKGAELRLQLRKWQNTIRETHAMQLLAHRIVTRRVRSRLSVSFYNWIHFAHASLVLRQQEKCATVRCNRSFMGRALRAVLYFSHSCKINSAKKQRIAGSVYRRKLVGVFCAWFDLVQEMRNMEIQFSMQHRRISQMIRHSVFDAWSSASVSTCISDWNLLRVSFAKQQRRQLCLCFCSWQVVSQTGKQGKINRARAAQHRDKVRKRWVTGGLRENMHTRQGFWLHHQRLATKHNRSVLLHKLRDWRETWHERKVTFMQHIRFTQKAQSMILVQTLRKWNTTIRAAMLDTMLVRIIESRNIRRCAVVAFCRLADQRLESRALRKKSLAISRKRSSKLAHWVLGVWMLAASSHRHHVKQDLIINARRNMRGRGTARKHIHCWLVYALRQKVLARAGKLLASRWSRSRCMEVLQALHVMQQTEKRHKSFVQSARLRKRMLLMFACFDALLQSVHASASEALHKAEVERLATELAVTKNDLCSAVRSEADTQQQLDQLHQVRIPALESENMSISEKLELIQMELEAKESEALSTKTQVSMLHETIAEMRGFLNDPELMNASGVGSNELASIKKDLEAERTTLARLQAEVQHKDAEISQLSTQIMTMEQQVTRAQKAVETIESQTSADIQVISTCGCDCDFFAG
jgi:predicted  nucleic acid-binding Zn-ribbon protein